MNAEATRKAYEPLQLHDRALLSAVAVVSYPPAAVLAGRLGKFA
jgi:hypothetical protein